MTKNNILFFMYGISSLKGGGGAERFFADFFSKYQNAKEKKYNLYFLLDKKSIFHLKEVGKLKEKQNIWLFRLFSNRFKNQLEAFQLCCYIIIHRIKIVHIPLYNLSYIPLLKTINNLPRLFRPKLTINIVNCYVADSLKDEKSPYHNSFKATYIPLFHDIKVNGYFCWNKSFVDYVSSNTFFTFKPQIIQSIVSRFSDVNSFQPEKKHRWVVFASRLDEQKHPEMFLKALANLNRKNHALTTHWKFFICGDGPLRNELIVFSKENDLEHCVEFRIEGQMEKILNHSQVYVSCQSFDNFPSLTMSEAMASGNAIIARNVGQTSLFVKNTINGLILEQDNEFGLEKALIQILSDDVLVSRMGKASEGLIKDVHNFENFVTQIEDFWSNVLSMSSE